MAERKQREKRKRVASKISNGEERERVTSESRVDED